MEIENRADCQSPLWREKHGRSDPGHCEAHYFINLMGLGFVTDVAKTATRLKWTGNFSYVIGVLYHALGLTFHRMALEIDGKTISGKNCFVEVCNSRYTGGDMLMAPAARIDDGWFDVVIADPLSRVSLVSTLPNPTSPFFLADAGISGPYRCLWSLLILRP